MIMSEYHGDDYKDPEKPLTDEELAEIFIYNGTFLGFVPIYVSEDNEIMARSWIGEYLLDLATYLIQIYCFILTPFLRNGQIVEIDPVKITGIRKN